ncbi:MAG: C40 family peptidase [Treponema sp.]|nr:C40 family peptidase [Treponema sp.]
MKLNAKIAERVTQMSYKPAKGMLFVLLMLFSVCCFKLCAEDMSPAQAQVLREKFVAESKKYVGSPYVYGAVGPDSFDCSGLIYYVARESVGVQLPRTAKAIYNYCRIIPDRDKEIGDLLFFKTNSSDSITHVGIYIGNNQFISAISDGPNTGVIISSLNQDYWKPKYVACGQFLKSSKGYGLNDDKEVAVTESSSKKNNSKKSSSNKESTGTVSARETADRGSYSGGVNSFVDSLVADATLCGGWSLIAPNEFMIRFRGVELQSNVRYSKMTLQPGFSVGFRYNCGVGVFQIPLLFTATPNEYFRFYAGPIITFGKARMLKTEEEIKPSVFPGVLGLSFSTPSIEVGKTKIQLVQDLSYTVFNNPDNSALPFVESLSSGFIFYTGVRVTLGIGSLFR